MDITSSRKKSPASLTKTPAAKPKTERPSFAAANRQEFEDSYDTAPDLIERVRQARAAAERKMREFSGDWNDYVLVAKIVGQKASRAEEQRLKDGAPLIENKGQMPFSFGVSEERP